VLPRLVIALPSLLDGRPPGFHRSYARELGSCEVLACHGRPLPVSLHLFFSLIVAQPLFSWELLTTLDYEWSVIRRRRPYRWTIWVRHDNRFAFVSREGSQTDFRVR